MNAIPVLETERLILRGFQPGDTAPFTRALADPEFARTITREGRGLDEAEAWRTMAVINGSWSLCGFGNWVAELKDTGEAIGRLGPFAPPGWPGFEVGWAIFPQFQRKGYAAEGVAAALTWCHETLVKDVISHCILKGNTGSEALARALGGKPARDWTPPWGGDVTIWETHWDDFTQSRPGRAYLTYRGGSGDNGRGRAQAGQQGA